MFIKVVSAQKLAVPPSLSRARFFSLSFNLSFLTPHIHSYNGCLSSGDKGRRRSRLALSRRPHANGVKPDVMHHISTPLVSKASSTSQHTGAPVLPSLAKPHRSWGGPCSFPHCLLGCQGNGADGRAFAAHTVLYSLQCTSLTTRPHPLDGNGQHHCRGSQGSERAFDGHSNDKGKAFGLESELCCFQVCDFLPASSLGAARSSLGCKMGMITVPPCWGGQREQMKGTLYKVPTVHYALHKAGSHPSPGVAAGLGLQLLAQRLTHLAAARPGK